MEECHGKRPTNEVVVWGGEEDIFAFLEAERCSHSLILTAQTAAGSLSSWGGGGYDESSEVLGQYCGL